MAQYQKNFYGTSYYGENNVYSGTYETKEILTDEPFQSTVSITVRARLPHVHYTVGDVEVQKITGSWTKTGDYFVSSTLNDKLQATLTSDYLAIHFKKTLASTSTVNVKVTTKVVGGTDVVTNHTFSAKAATAVEEGLSTFVINNLPFASHTVEISIGVAGSFQFKSVEGRVANVVAETRARLNTGTFTAYTKVPLTVTKVKDDQYDLTGTTASYQGKNRLQINLHLGSSDNDVSPIIEAIDTYAGNTSNRTEDGQWEATFKMKDVATAVAKTFSRFVALEWTAQVPNKTKLIIRTTSSKDGVKWTPLSVPYALNRNRVRLKEGRTIGHITTPLINPASTNAFLRIHQWEKWQDESYLPLDATSTYIRYSFLDEKNNVLHQIENPEKIVDRNLLFLLNKPFRLRVEIKRRFDKATPAVDLISLVSNLIYEEKKEIADRTISAIDNHGTGKQIIFDMKNLVFTIPAEAASPSYSLIDQTVRPEGIKPEDITIYFDSEKEASARTNKTLLATDKIWAESRGRTASEKAGVLKHFQYGGGLSYFELADRTPITSAFTPSLNPSKEYRYFLSNGWPKQYHTVSANETFISISELYGKLPDEIEALNPKAQINKDGILVPQQVLELPGNASSDSVELFWATEEETAASNRTQVTERSAHNAAIRKLADQSDDLIVSEVRIASEKGMVPWVSEEKIYFGVCNLNDIEADYLREHKIPISGSAMETSYVAQLNDTYQSIAERFGIYEEDLRLKNQASSESVVKPGQTLLIPSKIVLPQIDPRVLLGENPYEINIVYNSVKQNNEPVEDSRINRITLEVVREEVEIIKEEVTRSSIPNTMDLLNNPGVTEITGVWDDLNSPVSAVSYLEDVHYKRVDNFINWDPMPGGLYEEPAPNATYYVSYKCMKPVAVKVRIGSDHKEVGGTDYLWRSSEVKEFKGVTIPGLDYRGELPPISEWPDSNNPDVTDIDYVIEDNDLWVKTWIEKDVETGKAYAVGSLEGRRPKDNWFPTIHTGYYYIGKDEYYLFSEPVQVAFEESDVPIAKNITYVEGKYKNAAKMERASTNLIRNSGFDVSNEQQVIFKQTF